MVRTGLVVCVLVAGLALEARAQSGQRFCSTTGETAAVTEANCRPDKPLETQLNTANEAFLRKNYQVASKVFLDAFSDTPFRPADGEQYGRIISALAEAGQYEAALVEVLRRDQLLPRDDFRVWSDLALIARRIAVTSGNEAAQQMLRQAFTRFPSSKLRSDVWPLLPKNTISHLKDRVFNRGAVYGRETEHPKVRNDLLKFIGARPDDPLIALAHFAVGDYQAAVSASGRTPFVRDVLHYAAAFEVLHGLSEEIREHLAARPPIERTKVVRFGTAAPEFTRKADTVRPWLQVIVRDYPRMPHADDAAFWLGWLAFHQGQDIEALAHFSDAMQIGNSKDNTDYRRPAARRSVAILDTMTEQQRRSALETLRGLRKEPAVWYATARAAFREFNYDVAIKTAEEGLRFFEVPPERMPGSTSKDAIERAIDAVVNPGKAGDDPTRKFVDVNIYEMPYLVVASREIAAFEASLRSAATENPEELTKRVRKLIEKYALTHGDHRQVVHIIDVSLASVRHQPLREWLHYRKVRALVSFAPELVEAAVQAMAVEHPRSSLMDDALAEQLFAEISLLGDYDAARRTFRKLTTSYPDGNALDNAHNWMAIMYRCQGDAAEERRMNLEIIRRFPLTRHAYYAFVRLSSKKEINCSGPLGSDDDTFSPQYRTRAATTIYKGPGRTFAELVRVGGRVALTIERKDGEWYAIRVGDGMGFVRSQDLECFARCAQ